MVELNEKALAPCPFCGAPAEVDMSRGFRALQGGRLHSGVAIYCSAYCHVDMMLSRADLPEYDDEQLFAILAENWNKRPSALTAPDDGLEVVAWVQGAALDELAKHKDATATIASGLLPSPFGSPVALVRLSDAQATLQSKDEQIERLTRERDAELALAIANGSRAKEEHYRAEATEQQVQKLTDALRGLVKAVGGMKNPQTIEDVALLVGVTLGPAYEAARSALETQEGGE